MSWVYPWFFPVAGSSTPWKATSPSPTVSTIWLACARERRGYLWGGSRVGGSTLGGGSGGGLCALLGGTAGGTLGGAWGSVLCCCLDICTVVRVCLVGWVGFGGAPVAANISDSFWMASMVWAPKRAKGAAGAGFERASSRRLDASVATLAEETYLSGRSEERRVAQTHHRGWIPPHATHPTGTLCAHAHRPTIQWIP